MLLLLQVRIPDDKEGVSPFQVTREEVSNQLRDILEDKTIESSEVFDLARSQYQACMDTEKLEEIGLEPMNSILQELGGWPVLETEEAPWDETNFLWDETIFKLRSNGMANGRLTSLILWTNPTSTGWW